MSREFPRRANALRSPLLLLILLVTQLPAAEPLVRNLNLRGLQVGGTTTLVIDGDHLAGAKLLLPFATTTALKPDSTDKKATLDVNVPADIPAGYYNLRVVTADGVSLPQLVSVDKIPHVVAGPAIVQRPISLHGSIGGSAIFETKFTANAGEEIAVEVESQRLGGKLRPVLHLYNAKRRQLAWSWPQTELFGDTRLEIKAPETGEYIVTLHDLEYGPPAPSFYRLKIGSFAAPSRVFPPVIAKGQAAKLQLDAAATDFVDVAAQSASGAVPLTPNNGPLWSGPRPFVAVSSHAEMIEELPPPEGYQALPAELVGVSGRLSAPYEEDRYRVAVTPGIKLRLEVFAERYGTPIDTALIVRNDKGDPVARGEDGPGTTDPTLEYTPPKGVTSITVGVADVLGRGNPRGIYRLTVSPRNAANSDLRLTTPMQRVTVAKGGRAIVPVFVDRDDEEYALELSGVGLPPGVRIEGGVVPADRDGALVTFVREGDGEATVARLRGKSADGREQIVVVETLQPGQQRPQPMRMQPWLDQELTVALPAAEASAFQIDWRDLPTDAALIPGRKLPLPIKLVRPDDKLVVRLSLVTSQAPTIVNNTFDQNRMLRAEAAVELAANALEGQLSLAIPAELPQAAYQVAVQAELLTADKQSVVARAFTPIRDLPVKHQLHLQLAGPNKIETPLDAKTGAMVRIDGKLERREGLTGDVQVQIAGLPQGVQGNAINVKADTTDFSFVINIPPTFPPGEIKNLKLSANAADPANNNVRVSSRPIPLSLVVQPPPQS